MSGAAVEEQFARQNRWWLDSAAIDSDRHVVRLRSAKIQWTPDLPFRFDQDAIYTLRGPRQVGKSTVLKRQIEQLLSNRWPARRILYLDVELAGLERAADLVASLRTYLDGERSPRSPGGDRLAVFLDEVTRVENWAGALRGLVDNDELRDVTVVATGSHTRDLRRGGERLPGRRGGGGGHDVELLPLSFREYVAAIDPSLPLPPPTQILSVGDLSAETRERAAIRPRLIALLQRYLASGGFLLALNDVADTGAVRPETFQVYREAISGEFTRAGLREAYLRQVINWVAAHQGQEFDARGIAADTDIGSKDTAQNYVDHLVADYVAAVHFRAASLNRPSPSFRAPKKLHPLDPLLWHLIRAWAASDPDPWAANQTSLNRPDDVGHLVESVLAIHLRRAFGGQVFYWQPDQRREIDFVVEHRDGRVSLVESKHQARVDERDARHIARAGGGIVASRSWEGYLAGGTVYALPVAELLMRLEAPSLSPSPLP